MSGGGSSSGGTTVTQNQIPAWLQDAYQTNINRATGVADQAFTPYGGQRTAADNDLLGTARYRALQAADMGQGQIAEAARRFTEAGNQSPMFINADQAGPAAQRNAAQIGDVLDVTAERATAGTIPQQNLQAYLNPYTGAVVDQSNREIERQREMVQGKNAAAAAAAGGFGGSRHGIVDGENNRNFGQLAADNTNTLLQGGYDRATGLMTSDLDRGANVSMFNSDWQNRAMTGNADRDLAARTADAGMRQQAMLDYAGAQDSLGQYNAGMRQQASLANQGHELDTTRVNMQGAQGLLGAGAQQQQQYLAGVNALGAAGQQVQNWQQGSLDKQYEEFLRQQNLPYQNQQLVNSAVLGISPGAVGTQSSTNNSKAKGYAV